MPDATFTVEEVNEALSILPWLGGNRAHEWDEIVFIDFVEGTPVYTFPEGGSRLLPCHGKVVVTGEIGPDLGVLKSHSRNGARVIDKGLKPCRAKIKLSVWDDIGFRSIEALSRFFEPRKRKLSRSAFRIKHPALAQMGVNTVVFEKLIPLAESGTQGMLTTEITVVEWYAPVQRKKNVSHTVVAAQDPGSVLDPFSGTNRSPSATQFNHLTPAQRALFLNPSRTNTGP